MGKGQKRKSAGGAPAGKKKKEGDLPALETEETELSHVKLFEGWLWLWRKAETQTKLLHSQPTIGLGWLAAKV